MSNGQPGCSTYRQYLQAVPTGSTYRQITTCHDKLTFVVSYIDVQSESETLSAAVNGAMPSAQRQFQFFLGVWAESETLPGAAPPGLTCTSSCAGLGGRQLPCLGTGGVRGLRQAGCCLLSLLPGVQGSCGLPRSPCSTRLTHAATCGTESGLTRALLRQRLLAPAAFLRGSPGGAGGPRARGLHSGPGLAAPPAATCDAWPAKWLSGQPPNAMQREVPMGRV